MANCTPFPATSDAVQSVEGRRCDFSLTIMCVVVLEVLLLEMPVLMILMNLHKTCTKLAQKVLSYGCHSLPFEPRPLLRGLIRAEPRPLNLF
jgi:hypothetical protein